MAHTKLRAVLVDIDGTLIDSNDAHTRAWQQALARRGHEFSYDEIRPLIGKGGDKLLETLIGVDGKSSLAEEISAERGAIFLGRELHALLPTRGARDLIERLRASGLRVVVATSAEAAETGALLSQAGLDDLIDQAASAADAEDSKPDPDIVQSALRKAGVRPSEAVMIGDTPFDLEAARRAGVSVVLLRCGGWWNDDAFKGALCICDDPADLLQKLGVLPWASPV